MAYGDKRNRLYSDAFDSISASWTNSVLGAGAIAVSGDGGIQPGSVNAECIMAYNSSPAADQYSTVTVQTLSAADYNEFKLLGRTQASFTGYYEFRLSSGAGAGHKYELFVVTSSGASEVSIANTGTPGALNAGWTVTMEIEGTTLRGGTNEGSGDTQQVTTTDNTHASGGVGIDMLALSVAARDQITAWEAGNIAPIPPVAATQLIVRRLRTRYAA